MRCERSTPITRLAAQAMFGGAAIATGPGRYVNRALGVTLDERSPADIDAIEQFFAERALPAAVEVSSWAPAATIDRADPPRLPAGVVPVDVHDVADRASRADGTRRRWSRRSTTPTSPRGSSTYAVGFGVADGQARAISDEFALATRLCPDARLVLATVDGSPAGCGAVHVAEGVAWLGGAATMPAFRRHGVQATLVAHRLRMATELGCDIAAATAVPSGASARNLVRLGWQLVQTQLVVQQPPAPT